MLIGIWRLLKPLRSPWPAGRLAGCLDTGLQVNMRLAPETTDLRPQTRQQTANNAQGKMRVYVSLLNQETGFGFQQEHMFPENQERPVVT